MTWTRDEARKFLDFVAIATCNTASIISVVFRDDTYFKRTGRIVQILVLASQRIPDLLDDFRRRTGYRAPARRQHSCQLDLAAGKVPEELHRHKLAHVSARGHQACVRDVGGGERDEVGSHDEAGIDDGKVFESGILEDEGANDGEVDV